MRTLAAILALLAATPASAQREPYEADWMVIGDRAPTRTVILQEKGTEPFTQIVPRTAFRLASAAVDDRGEVLVPAGTILTGVRGKPGAACEVVRRPGRIRPACLHDRDGDRRFDAWNTILMGSDGVAGDMFFTALPWRAETKPLAAPVAFTALDVRTQVPRLRLELWFENRAELVGKNDILLCIDRQDLGIWRGKPTGLRMCRAAPGRLGDGDYPRTLDLYGGTMVFAAREANRVRVVITPPPADQPY